jgi:hypothetical protein
MTFSIRNIRRIELSRPALFLSAMLGAATAGCYHAPTPATSAPPPLVIDEAMQARDWSQSEAYYQNGGVRSTPLRTVFTTGPHNSRILTSGLETGAFIGNAANMPLTLLNHPFNSKVVYHGEQLEPSFNAMPPLPATNASSTHVNDQPLTGSPVGVH